MKTLLSLIVFALVAVGQQPPLRPVRVTLTSSATDTYAGTASPTLTAYVSGQIIMFTANATNVGAASIAVDAAGALTIVKVGGGIATTLVDNDIRSGQQVMCQYDGTNCQLLAQLGNAAAGGGGGSSILAGYANGNAIAQATTSYYTFTGFSGGLSEVSGEVALPRAGTVQHLSVKIGGAQPASQTLTCTVRRNLAADAYNATPIDTLVTLTIPGGGGAGWYSSGTTSVSVAAGDRITLGCTQQAGALASAALRAFSVEVLY